MEIFTQYKKIIFVFVSLALLGSGIWLYVYLFNFYVVSVNPSYSSSVSFLTPVISVDFNKELQDKNIEVLSPDGLVVSSVVDNKKLNINIFSGLVADEEYLFVIKSISSTDNKTVSDYEVKFSTNNSTVLSKSEQELTLLRQQSNKPAIINDPVLSYLPYYTSEYLIKSYLDGTSDNKGVITLEIIIFLSREDSETGRVAAIERIKASSNVYLQSLKDIDISDYAIIYKVQEP